MGRSGGACGGHLPAVASTADDDDDDNDNAGQLTSPQIKVGYSKNQLLFAVRPKVAQVNAC